MLKPAKAKGFIMVPWREPLAPAWPPPLHCFIDHFGVPRDAENRRRRRMRRHSVRGRVGVKFQIQVLKWSDGVWIVGLSFRILCLAVCALKPQCLEALHVCALKSRAP